MIETLIDIIQHPATWALLGIVLKTFCPASIPFLGAGKKLVLELTELHEKNERPNYKIKKDAADLGLSIAQKWIEKKLSDR